MGMQILRRRKAVALIIAIITCVSLLLCGCAGDSRVCYYGYFGDTAYAFIYTPRNNHFNCIQLPLEEILLWGKASGLSSIPIAMGNFVGLKDSGFLVGSSDALLTLKDMLDVLGSENEEPAGSVKRVETMVAKASVLSKRPLSDKINQLCGQDSEKLLKLLAEKNPSCWCYDAHSFFDSDDLNFSQRYFSQWLEQVLGGNK
ncbi:MAG: hypothetical protein IJ863_05375 [Spirochaetales bacterium]|nr:hypothetical protein [Spirochaetales bacterium]